MRSRSWHHWSLDGSRGFFRTPLRFEDEVKALGIGPLSHGGPQCVRSRARIAAVPELKTFPGVFWKAALYSDRQPTQQFSAAEGAAEVPRVTFN